MQRLPLLSRRARKLDLPSMPKDFLRQGSKPKLVDSFGRSYRYLRLSVTDRCNFRCSYCMPNGGEIEHGTRHELLTFEENERLVRLLAKRGIRRVRLTGGEPLVRKNCVELVSRLNNIDGIDEIVMTTNATDLPRQAKSLAAAGLRGVNISLDTLSREKFMTLCGKDQFDDVLAGIDAAIDAGIKVKINTVALKGINEEELEDIVQFAWEKQATPRIIEKMPLGLKDGETHLGSNEIWKRLGNLIEINSEAKLNRNNGPARYRQSRESSDLSVGVISAVSNKFCGSCNRIRITAQGELRACLGNTNAVDLREKLRGGASDDEIAWAVQWALDKKAYGHSFSDPESADHRRVGMSLIGG